MADELLQWRSEFPILDKSVYLISHSLGAMPRETYDKLHEYAEIWATRGVRAWAEGWWEMPQTVGDMVAQIIGAPPASVVMHQNVSICQALILSCMLPLKDAKRNKIVYSELNFPSVMYVYEAHAKAHGLQIATVASDDGMTVPLERLLAAIDETTLLVPVSHVLFKSAFLQDAQAIVQRAHEVGAKVVLDTYQSAGTVPLNATELGVDFITGGSVKWLCGGPGAGYLYVRPDLQTQLEPQITGWAAHVAPFAFEAGPIRYADDIHASRTVHRRFPRSTRRSPAIASLTPSASPTSVPKANVKLSILLRWQKKQVLSSPARATPRNAAALSPSPTNTRRHSPKKWCGANLSWTTGPVRACASRRTFTIPMKS